MDIEFHPRFKKELENLPPRLVKKVFDTLELVEKYGLGSLSRAKEVKKINPHGVLAVKIRWDRVRYRVLGFVEEMCFWTLLIFKQKSKKIPQKHLKTAMWRKRQIKNLYKSGQKIFSIKSK